MVSWCSAETRRYPFVSGIDHETAIARSTALPVLYGRDGRRRLAGGAVSLSTDEGQILEPTEIRAASDPTGKALSSPDVIVAVFGFLDRYVYRVIM